MYNPNQFYYGQQNQINPYGQYNNQVQTQNQVIKVHGEDGAKAYAMQPNSSVLLLDETTARLFLKQTDGAGYPSISSYKLEPWVDEPSIDYTSLNDRITKLEEIINVKSNTTKTKPKNESE